MNQDLNRRKDDRHPTQPLQWDDKPDLLAMRAGVNEIQREIERARAAGLTMLALPVATANAACCYVAHLGERLAESVTAAPAEQASKQVPTEELDCDSNHAERGFPCLCAEECQPAAPVAATEQARLRVALESIVLRPHLAVEIAQEVLFATPADAGAGDALTDDDIDSFIIKGGVMDRAWPKQTALHEFARAIERAVLARLSTSPAPVTAESVAHVVDIDRRMGQSTIDAAIELGTAVYFAPVSPQPAAQVPSAEHEAGFIAGWNDALVSARAEIRSMQDNLETFGPYGQETARVALDGALDAIDELKGQPAAAHAAKKGGQQ